MVICDRHVAVDVADRFDNGKNWFAWIDYDGATLEVRANQTGRRPDAPLLKYPIDIAQVIGSDTAFVGFTAATGGAMRITTYSAGALTASRYGNRDFDRIGNHSRRLE